MENSLTLTDFMTEIMTWVTFTPEQLEKAKASDINDHNSKKLMKLVARWTLGEYDEDIDALKQEVLTLIPK